MSRQCSYCGKATTYGRNISHAHNVTSRTFKPNLQKVRAWIDGSVQRVYACTRCLRSGKVVKPPVRQFEPEATDTATT